MTRSWVLPGGPTAQGKDRDRLRPFQPNMGDQSPGFRSAGHGRARYLCSHDRYGLAGPQGDRTDHIGQLHYGVAPRPAAATTPGNLLKMQIPKSCPKPTESETWDGAQQTISEQAPQGIPMHVRV